MGSPAAGLVEAVGLARAGHRAQARERLLVILRADASVELAWHWLAHVAASPEEARTALERVLALNPGNARAREHLAKLAPPLRPPASGEERVQCPFCAASILRSARECERCRALLRLDSIEALVAQSAVDRKAISAAIPRLASRLGGAQDPALRHFLAIACVHAGALSDAVGHLEQLHALRPSPHLQGLVADLRARIGHAASAAARSAPAARAVPRADLLRVLLIDDSPTVHKLVRLSLERSGFEVHSAQDGLEGKALAADLVPDLILLDVRLPGVDGCEICRGLRTDPATEHIPVVMLSGRERVADKARAMEAGAVEYVTKPFDPQNLVRVLRDVSKQARTKA